MGVVEIKKRGRRDYTIPDHVKPKIVELWNLGFGAGSMALKLGIKSYLIQHHLRSLGLTRTHAEAHRAREESIRSGLREDRRAHDIGEKK